MSSSLLEEVLQHLKTSSLRLTRKRYRLLEALFALAKPVSAADLRDKAGLPESDLVTVYRSLEAFESIGIVQKIPLDQAGHLYELTAPNDHHHHFLCKKCHRVERMDNCIGKKLEDEARQRGFAEVSHVIEVYGICSDCHK